jgi:hypothetical protein
VLLQRRVQVQLAVSHENLVYSFSYPSPVGRERPRTMVSRTLGGSRCLAPAGTIVRWSIAAMNWMSEENKKLCTVVLVAGPGAR